MLKAIAVAVAICGAVMTLRQGTPNNPIEIGTIRWERSFERAQAESRRLDKPILVLFQEVPG